MLFILSVLIAVGALFVFLTARKKAEFNVMLKKTANLALAAAVGFSLLALGQCLTVIPAGHVGVVDFFGIVSDEPLLAGINPINPLARVQKYSIQTKEHKETMEVLSREGLTIRLEISALYRLNPDSAARVYKTISGGDYEGVILVPQFRSI
ncbi:MAG: SPFH domain-containing protein, partial [Bacteroidota bacterium]